MAWRSSGAGQTSTRPAATRPPAWRSSSRQTRAEAIGADSGGSPQAKRRAASVNRSYRRAVRRTLTGSKFAASSSRLRVPPVISVSRPPMTPARAMGPDGSAITSRSGSSSRSFPSSVTSASPASAGRTRIRCSATRS